MVPYQFPLEEECQRMQETNKNYLGELPYHIEKNILVRIVMILIVIEEPIMIEGPLKEEGTKVEVEGHQIEQIIRIEDILEEEDPLIEVEDPLIMEDPLEMDDIPDTLEDKDHWAHQDPLDQ